MGKGGTASGRRRWVPLGPLVVVLAAGLATSALGGGPARATYPPLPVAADGQFVQGLAAPILTAGGSGTVSGALHDPLTAGMVSVSLVLRIYAFEPYPGGASNTSLPAGDPVGFAGGASPGLGATVRVAAIAPGGSEPWSVTTTTAPSAPAGAYAVYMLLDFVENGTAYQLASRGYFPAATWASATTLPGHNSTLNLTTLGVSGILPETAIQVTPPSAAPWLWGLLGGAFALAAAGGYFAFRRPPKSRSGATG